MKNGEVERIEFSDYKKRFPLAGAYLRANKRLLTETVQLFPSLHDGFNAEESWHFYTREQNHKEYAEKVCVPMTSQFPEACVLFDGKTYCDNANMYFVTVPNNSSAIKLYALAAIFNSSWFATLARSIANPQQNGYFKFNKQFLDPLPFPCVSLENEDQHIKDLAATAQKIERINQRIAKSPTTKGNYTQALSALWLELDEIVEELYGVNSDPILRMKVIRDDRV